MWSNKGNIFASKQSWYNLGVLLFNDYNVEKNNSHAGRNNVWKKINDKIEENSI